MTQSSFHATALPIVAATFATMLGIGMLVPALPHVLKESAGGATAGAVAAGGLVSAFGIARLMVNLPAGALTDRIGIARTATIGLAILIVGSLIGVFAKTYAFLFLAIAMQGAGAAFFSSASMTGLILAAGPARRGAAMGWFQGSLLLAMSAGPVIGGVIVDAFGGHAPFAAQALLAAAAFAATRLLPGVAGHSAHAASPVTMRSLLGAALVAGAAVAFSAFLTRVGIAWNVVPTVAAQDYGLDPTTVGWIVGAGTLANLAVMPLSARLIDGWGGVRTALASAVLALAGLILMLVLPTEIALWVGTALVMAGTGSMIPAASVVALADVPRQATGRAMGLVRMAGDTGMAIGPVGLPTIAALIGAPVADGFAIAAAVVVLSVAVMVIAARRPARGLA